MYFPYYNVAVLHLTLYYLSYTYLLTVLFWHCSNFLPTGCAKKVGFEDFGVFFMTPDGIPSDLHGHLPGENLTGKLYILENF